MNGFLYFLFYYIYKMPRYTRDQQFNISFNDFIISMRDLYFPNLMEWTLNSITKNKGNSTHVYNFTIPRKIVNYTIDTPFVDENGITKSPEVVEIEQELPTIENFKNYFHGYFDSFILTNTNGKVLSYTSIFNVRFSNDNESSGDLLSTIVTYYYKSYIPYPSKMQTQQQIIQYCNQLEKNNAEHLLDLEDKNYIINSLKIKNKKQNRRFNREIFLTELKRQKNIYKMQEKIRNFYSKQSENDFEDCPVCYDKISVEKLKVPGCCHYICKDCHGKCETCPICREKY